MTTTYKWHEVYKNALLETDWSKMDSRIQSAETAIQQRRDELNLDHGGSVEENHAIEDAIRSLGVLKTEAALWAEKSKRKN